MQMYRTEIRMARMEQKAGNYYVPAEPKLALVVRIRGVSGVSPKVQKVLQLLRLWQIFSSTFVKLSKASVNMLRVVEPYIPKRSSNQHVTCQGNLLLADFSITMFVTDFRFGYVWRAAIHGVAKSRTRLSD